MNIKHLKQLVLLILFTAISCIASAQMHFKYSAALDSIKQSGFYRIPLSSSVLAKCQKDFADLRILDNAGSPAAYILQTEKGDFYTTPMIDLPIIKKGKEADKQWHVTLENNAKRSIDCIVLTVKRTSANRNITLSGSDDNKHWYVISENYNPEYTISQPDSRSLYFPLSSYRYFQITLFGKDLLPIDIEKTGVFSNKITAPQYSEIPLSYHLTQKDSNNKKSYIKISFDEANPIERIRLKLNAKYYKRHLSIYNSLDNMPLCDTVISSFNGEYPTINLSCKEKALWMVMDNEDNSPLKINEINFDQLNRSLVAYLDSSKKYQLYFGDSTLALPSYDIASFKDSINQHISAISIGTINKINIAYQPKLPSDRNKWILWFCIGLALLLLSGMTFKMLKDIGSRKQ